MINAAAFDVKPYDRQYLEMAANASGISWRFNEFRLSARTAAAAEGNLAVCVFVNDAVDRPCLELLKKGGVKLIALRCAGYNNVDLAAAREFGIQVTRVPAYSPNAVAEHAVALLMTLNRKIHRAYQRVREHNFSLNGLIGFDVYGKTVGVVGTGKIGQVAAQIFRGFGANVIAFDPSPNLNWASSAGVNYVDKDTLLKTSDIITLHAPLVAATHYFLNSETFSMLKPGCVVINTSRGKLIETKALIRALKSGRIGGVALDVYEEEAGIFFEDFSNQPMMDDELSRLLSFPNVLVTSHQAFLTHEALTEIARVTNDNIIRFGSGQELLYGTIL